MSDTLTDPTALAERCIESVLDARFDDGPQTGWPAWTLSADPSAPARMAADDVTLYNGDAGIAWTLGALGRGLERPELVEVARRAAHRVSDNVATLHGDGLLTGRAGAALAAYRCGLDPGHTTWRPGGSDLTAGAAGALLAQVRVGARPDRDLVRALARAAKPREVGWSWADPVSPEIPDSPLGTDDERGPTALCGLAHGASGVALALVEAVAVEPSLASALDLAAGALAWEDAWFEPMRGWPDLRGSDDHRDFPVWWCHGAAGITAARLRLLQLADAGAEVGMPLVDLRARAHAGVQTCLESVHAAASAAQEGVIPPAGLSLCHGLGGPLDTLAFASTVTGQPEPRDHAAAALAAVAALLNDDPLTWPCGTRRPGSCGLFLGVAGVALVAARLAWPEADLPSPSLLG